MLDEVERNDFRPPQPALRTEIRRETGENRENVFKPRESADTGRPEPVHAFSKKNLSSSIADVFKKEPKDKDKEEEKKEEPVQAKPEPAEQQAPVKPAPAQREKEYVTPKITVELGFSLDSTISLNLDTNSKIITTIETPKYRGFYGEVNKLSISNEKGKHIIQLDYPYENPYTVFLFYKTQRSFYIIFIKAKEKVPLDENVIQYLDLS
jgi:hypothetical protein